MSISAIWEGALDMLAPPRCAACDGVLDPVDQGFCGACDSLLERASDPGPRAAFVYGGPIADAVVRFKYGRRSEIADVFAPALIERALELAGEVDAVVPVPLHPRRQRARGFDQSALLARPVAEALAVPLRLRALVRVRDTPPQASLDLAARIPNVRAAFVARQRPGRRVLLLDDVRTTGATLAECARALTAGGCERVHTLVLARADP